MTKIPAARPFIYVAGPYTNPDPVMNTHRAIMLGDRLYREGFFPVVPHLTMLAHLVCPRPYEHWLEFDLHWLSKCDVLLRLPGPSSGADKEIKAAKALGIPVILMATTELTEGDLFSLREHTARNPW